MLRLTKCKDNDKIIYRLIDSSSNEICSTTVCLRTPEEMHRNLTEQEIEKQMKWMDANRAEKLIQDVIRNIKVETIDVSEDKKIQALNKVYIIEEEFTEDK